MNENLQKIREACIRANREIVTDTCGWCGLVMDGNTCSLDSSGDPQPHQLGHTEFRPIRLADVLLAWKQKNTWMTGWKSAEHSLDTLGIMDSWNLRQDDLEKQSPQTVEFIASLV